MVKVAKSLRFLLKFRPSPIGSVFLIAFTLAAATGIAFYFKARTPLWLMLTLPFATFIFSAKSAIMGLKYSMGAILAKYENRTDTRANLVRILCRNFTADWTTLKLLRAALWLGGLVAVLFSLLLNCKSGQLGFALGLPMGAAAYFATRFASLATASARRNLRVIEINSGALRKEKAHAYLLWIICSALTIIGTLLSLSFLTGVSRGRQLRRRGRPVLPPLIQCTNIRRLSTAVAVDAERRDELAARWRNNGLTEHASVAAFSRLAFQLMALNAPPYLIAAAHRDALDEIRHARLCFSLAQAIDGQQSRPGAVTLPAPSRTFQRIRLLALATLAIESLVEGALLEGVSARVISALADRCNFPAIGTVLKALAGDEFRHAAHGWEVVDWCLQQGGLPVLCALKANMRKWPESFSAQLPSNSLDCSWEVYGIAGHALEQREYSQVREALIRRVELFTFTTSEAPV